MFRCRKVRKKEVNEIFDSFGVVKEKDANADLPIIEQIQKVDKSKIEDAKAFRTKLQMNALKQLFYKYWPEIKLLCVEHANKLKEYYKKSFLEDDCNEEEIDLFDLSFAPGDQVQTIYGKGTVARVENNLKKLIIELDDWILANETRPTLFCDPSQVTLLKRCLEVNSNSIFPPHKWVNIKKLSVVGDVIPEEDEFYGKDVVLEETYGIDSKYAGYVGKVLDAGLDQRWRRVQLYPTRYQRIRQQLEYYKIHDMTENGEILTTVEKKRMERQMVKAKYGVSFEFVNNNSIQRMIDRNKDAISNGMPVVTWKQAALSLLLPYESITNEKKL